MKTLCHADHLCMAHHHLCTALIRYDEAAPIPPGLQFCTGPIDGSFWCTAGQLCNAESDCGSQKLGMLDSIGIAPED